MYVFYVFSVGILKSNQIKERDLNYKHAYNDKLKYKIRMYSEIKVQWSFDIYWSFINTKITSD